MADEKPVHDPVHQPYHYRQAIAPLEPIDVLRYAPFDLGCSLKYVIRAGFKGNTYEDLKKALVYANWADESASVKGSPYIDFFNTYGILLRKFERLKDVHGIIGLRKTIHSMMRNCPEYEDDDDKKR